MNTRILTVMSALVALLIALSILEGAQNVTEAMVAAFSTPVP